MLLSLTFGSILLTLDKAQEVSYGMSRNDKNHFIYPAGSTAPGNNLVFKIGDTVVLEWTTTSINYTITLNQDAVDVAPEPIIYVDSDDSCALTAFPYFLNTFKYSLPNLQSLRAFKASGIPLCY